MPAHRDRHPRFLAGIANADTRLAVAARQDDAIRPDGGDLVVLALEGRRTRQIGVSLNAVAAADHERLPCTHAAQLEDRRCDGERLRRRLRDACQYEES